MTKHCLTLLLLIAALLATGCQPITPVADRQLEVAAKGAEVMPFDLERTTHVFSKQEHGGVQQVIADDGDAEQIALIRAHLAEEAARFSLGNFHDPTMIHGEQMAGLPTDDGRQPNHDRLQRVAQRRPNSLHYRRPGAGHGHPPLVRRPGSRSWRARHGSPVASACTTWCSKRKIAAAAGQMP